MATLLMLSVYAILTGGDSPPRCDLVEINHYQPADGSGFVQVIAWDWDSQYRRWHAQQWAIVSDWKRVGRVVYCVGYTGEVRVSSKLFRETWTETDPERANKVIFPENLRRQVW